MNKSEILNLTEELIQASDKLDMIFSSIDPKTIMDHQSIRKLINHIAFSASTTVIAADENCFEQ